MFVYVLTAGDYLWGNSYDDNIDFIDRIYNYYNDHKIAMKMAAQDTKRLEFITKKNDAAIDNAENDDDVYIFESPEPQASKKRVKLRIVHKQKQSNDNLDEGETVDEEATEDEDYEEYDENDTTDNRQDMEEEKESDPQARMNKWLVCIHNNWLHYTLL